MKPQETLTDQQAEAVNQLREILRERQLRAAAVASPPQINQSATRSGDNQCTSSTEDDEDTPSGCVLSPPWPVSSDTTNPLEEESEAAVPPQSSFIPQPTVLPQVPREGRRASVAVAPTYDPHGCYPTNSLLQHFAPPLLQQHHIQHTSGSAYALKVVSNEVATPSTTCTEYGGAGTPSWTPSIYRQSSACGGAVIKSEMQTQTQPTFTECRGSQTTESCLQLCERGAQVHEEDLLNY